MIKKGKHSVSVARQYCGRIGKQNNGQVAVTLAPANKQASLPIAHRLYLPERRGADPDRRAKAGVPDAILFRSSDRGHAGGRRIAVDLSSVALRQLHAALGEPAILAIGNRNETPDCIVEQSVNATLSGAFAEAEACFSYA